jgi:PAS domain S-box-containing protein
MPIEDFKRIVESLKVPVAITDARGTVVFANEALAQMVERDPRDILQKPLTELFTEGDRKRIAQNVTRVGEGKAGSAFVDAQLFSLLPTERWMQVALQPALDARDKAAGVIAVLHDIGTQREVEDAMNLLTARLLALTESSFLATMIETTPGDIELVNDAFCRLLAIDSAPQSLSGLPVEEVLSRSPLVDPKALTKVLRKSGQAATLALTSADGRVVTLQRQPILVESEPAGALWLPVEETQEREVTMKGAADLALIEKIGEELSVALEGMSAISIRAQQMEFDPAIVQHFQSIRTSTETAMAAIGDLVDFSKLSGGVVLRKAQFGLRAALAELISRLTPNAEEHQCRLRIKVEQDVADALEGDVDRLQLVLKNLIDNAFVLLPGAEITLQITPEYVTESGIQLSFSVVAAGVNTQTHASKGSPDTGMGVAVAKFMVSAMGGKLAVAPRPVNDALYAFTIEFPLREAPPPPRRATYVSLVGLTVLVVSADADQRLALTNLLRGWRLIPLEADNAPMAMALLERMDEEGQPIPLVILSNRLPVQDGFLLAFRIKHHPKFNSSLVMMLASEGKPGDAIACRENGIAAYMRYPINDRQLNEAIMAVTGASVDADETPTLVTRHSLREQRKGATILLVDPSRDSQILAAHIFGRLDCSVVVAQDLAEALAALDQDVYDIVIVDTSLMGLGGDDAAKLLRSRIQREPEAATLVAASLDHTPAFAEAKTAAGFNSTIAKPFRKEALLGLMKSLGRLTAEADQ